jgi:outer membrane protein OmpA-like peptidoglycan-associated protein
MQFKGYGETKLVNECKDGVKCTEEKHQANRRTEFTVLKLD